MNKSYIADARSCALHTIAAGRSPYFGFD